MLDQIETLRLLVEASEVSHTECAQLITLLEQAKFYIAHKAAQGDLYALNLKQQIMKEAV